MKTGVCKEKCGQAEPDLEAEVRIRPFEASLEGSGRCQESDQGWSGTCKQREPRVDTWGTGGLELGRQTGKQTLAAGLKSSSSIP